MNTTFKFLFPVNKTRQFAGDLEVSGNTDSDGIHITRVLWNRQHGKEPVDVTVLICWACESLWERLELAAYNHCDGDSNASLSGINQVFSLENDMR